MTPDNAPVGTVAVTSVSETTVKLVAGIEPNATCVVCVRLFPVIVTGVPAAPLEGRKVVITGVISKY